MQESRRPPRIKLLAILLACGALAWPVPATQAASFPTGEDINDFHDEVAWTFATSREVSGDNTATNSFGQASGPYYPLGFRMPVDSFAADVEFNLTSVTIPKWTVDYFRGAGSFNPGAIHSNTSTQFDLRYGLNYASPFETPNPSNPLNAFPTTGVALKVAAGDFDGDGRADAALLTDTAIEIHFQGTTNFTRNVTFPINGTPVRILAADLNADGRMDIIAGTRNNAQQVILYPILQFAGGVLRSEGAQVVITGAAQAPNDMAAGDLTGDGRPEIAFIFANQTVRWAEQFGGKNVDTWFTDVYSVDRNSTNLSTRPNVVAVPMSNCSATMAAGQIGGGISILYQNMSPVTTLAGHTLQVNGLAYSPTCNYLASVGSEGRLNIWVAATNTNAASVSANAGAAFAVAFSPDGTHVATGGAVVGGNPALLRVWNVTPLPSNISMEVNVTESDGSILALDFSPDGSILAVGTSGGNVHLYETSGYTLVGNLTGHTETLRSLAFHPSGTYLASGSADDRLIIWDVANQTQFLNYTHAAGDVVRVRFSPNGTLLAAGSQDGHLRVYRTDTWALSDDITAAQTLYSFDFGPLSSSLFVAAGPFGQDTNIRVWDKSHLLSIAGWQTRQEFSVLGVAYSPSGALAAAAAEDGTVVVINATTGAQVTKIFAHNGTANSVAWSPSGAYLATAGADGRVRVYSTTGYGEVTNMTFAGNLSRVAFTRDGALLAASSSTGNVSVWDTSDWSQDALLSASNRSINSFAFDPTGTKIVVGTGANTSNNTVIIFDALSGARLMNLSGMSVPVRAVAWSPDGQTIAAGGNGTNLYMWYAVNGSLYSNQVAHSGTISALAFSPDSLRLASGGFDRQIYAWSVATGLLAQRVSTLPPSSNEVRSLDWASDGTRLIAGWNDYRFPITRSSAPGAGAGTGWGVKIGNVDGAAGNEIVVLVSNTMSGSVWYLPFSGGNPTTWVTTGGQTGAYDGAQYLGIGDFDGDGAKDDIVAVSPSAGSSNLYLQQHNSTDEWNQVVHSVFISQSVRDMAVADVTDDGHDDILLVAWDTTLIPALHEMMVIYWDPFIGNPANMKYQTISRYPMPAVATCPSGVAVADFNGDGLLDAVTANGAQLESFIFRQLDTLYGRYISAPLQHQQLPGLPIVSAFIEYDITESRPETSVNFFLSVNNGLTWTPVTRNQTVNFSATEGTQLRVRIDFAASHAGVTGIVQQMWAHYQILSVGRDPRIDLGVDGIIDWNITGVVAGTTRVVIPGNVVNLYMQSHLFLVDANNTIQVPIFIRWIRPGGYNLTDLSVPYNLRPPPPVLIAPASGAYASAQPALTVTSYDQDGEPIKYRIEVSLSEDFSSPLIEYDQNLSNSGFICGICPPGVPAGKVVEDADRLVSGQKYYWRARAFDGQQWSLWSPTWNFTVDDQPPEGFAASPAYATVLQFTVTWVAVDAVGGSGLATYPYDLQWKDGLNGTWTDWQIATNATSAIFSPAENGHTYCFRMRSVDAAGNQQIYLTNPTGDTCTTVDTDRPTATILPLDEYQQSAAFTIQFSAVDGASGSGVGGFDIEYKENNGSWVDGPQNYAAFSWTFVAQNDSSYCFRVAPRDRAGNVGNPTDPPVCTKVDTSPPAGSVIIPDTTTNLTCTDVSIVFADPQTGIIGYEVSVGTTAGAANIMAPTPYLVPPTRVCGLQLENEGTYFVNVRAQNGAGGFSPWIASNPMRVVIPGPVTTLTYPTGIWTQLNATLEIDIRDPLGFDIVAADLQYRRAAFRDNAIGTWGDFRTVPLGAGPMDFVFEGLVRGYAYEFKYRARNEVGSWGAYNGTGTLIVNQLPVAATGGDRRVAIGEVIQLDASATIDYDGARDQLTFTWETDDGRTINGPTGSISFDQPGVHLILLKVDDTHEVAIAEVYVFVEAPDPKQVLPGFDGAFALMGLLAAVAVAGALSRGSSRRR